MINVGVTFNCLAWTKRLTFDKQLPSQSAEPQQFLRFYWALTRINRESLKVEFRLQRTRRVKSCIIWVLFSRKTVHKRYFIPWLVATNKWGDLLRGGFLWSFLFLSSNFIKNKFYFKLIKSLYSKQKFTSGINQCLQHLSTARQVLSFLSVTAKTLYAQLTELFFWLFCCCWLL